MNTAPETHVSRNIRGDLSAKTSIALGVDRRELRIETSKRHSGGVSCFATVVQVHEDGRSYSYIIGFGSGGDYSKRLAFEPWRATEKAIRSVHAQGIAQVETVLAEVRAHYKLAEAA